MKKVIFLNLIVLLVVGVAEAATITVKADRSGDYPTIQAAIDAAVAGDEVVLELGTYTCQGNRDIDFLGKAITIRSNNPNEPAVVDSTIIDCQGTEQDRHRAFYFHTGEGLDSIIAGLTITNGYGQDEDVHPSYMLSAGGAIFCIGSSPTIMHCQVIHNYAGFKGGGFYIENGSPKITNCVFTDNSATYGVAIYNKNSNATVTNCTFTANSTNSPNSGGGAGIYNMYGSPKINNCTFHGNFSQELGGGIKNYESRATITSCIFVENSADFGGAIHNTDGNPTIANCTFSANSARTKGGAMASGGGHSTSTLTNCTFVGNYSAKIAGAIYYLRTNPILTNCVFRGNSADYGGAIYNDQADPTIASCAFLNNSGSDGGAIFNESTNLIATNCTFRANSAPSGSCMAFDSEHSFSSNLQMNNCILWDGDNEIWNNDGSIITITYSDVQGGWPGQGNINKDPDFALSTGYHLAIGSPCIDAGDPNYIAGPNETDLDGNPRVMDGRVDMGAYEQLGTINTAPVACIVGGDRVVDAGVGCDAHVTLDGSCSSDADSTAGTNDDIIAYDWYQLDPGDLNYEDYLGSGEVIECNLGLGEHVITLEVMDRAGAFDSNEVTITVEDVTTPEFILSVEPNVLWPPNHKMILVTPEWEVSDNCDEEVEVSLVDITMSSAGDINDDVQIGDDGSVYLRARRKKGKDIRVYTLTYEAVDYSGNVTEESTTVTVPHSRGPMKVRGKSLSGLHGRQGWLYRGGR